MQIRERWMRIGLLAVGIPSLLVGLWIRLAPHSFYTDFPGFGRHWVAALGPYDGHLVTDYGGTTVALSAALILIALRPSVRAVPVILGAWLLGTIPHFLYHAVATYALSTGDNIANLTLLGGEVAIPAVLLAGYLRTGTALPLRAAAPDAVNARIALAPETGLLRRIAYRSSRKQLQMVTTPIAVTAHHGTLLAGYGAFELATLRAHSVDQRLKELAGLRTAMLVGCEYCVDIGSALSRRSGISDDELRDLTRWRESTRFSALDRLVLAYAEAMTRTPAEIPDELFDGLRAQLDEQQLVELTSAIALENYRGRFNWAFGIGADGFSEGAYCVPPDRAPTAQSGQALDLSSAE